MRVYCGLASAGERLTTAVVDDVGRVLAVQQVNDDATGYAELVTVIAERQDEDGPVGIPIASDDSGRNVVRLLLAAGAKQSHVDQPRAEELATGEPPDAPDDARRAVAMARALCSGTLTPSVLPAPPELVELRPLLFAHLALVTSRVASVAALRQVLRQLYPAALRAFPDPGAGTPLAVLDALPDPVLLARGQDENVVARLSTAGYADASDALAALRDAIKQGNNGTSETVGVAVRQSVAAVRSCDTAAGALIREVAERVDPQHTKSPTISLPSTEPGSGFPEPNRSTMPVTAPANPFGSGPLITPNPWSPDGGRGEETPAEPAAAASGTGALPPVPEDITASLRPRRAGRRAGGPSEPATPAAERPTLPGEPEEPKLETPTDFQPTLINGNDEQPTTRIRRPLSSLHPVGTEDLGKGFDGTAFDPSAFDGSPFNGSPDETEVTAPPLSAVPSDPNGNAIVRPRRSGELGLRSRRRPRPQPAPPPRVDVPSDPLSGDEPMPPVSADDGDSELLIFSGVRSAWFSGDHNDTEGWDSAVDEGWRAAKAATRPTIGDVATDSGLPRRVPQANLVPGSALPADRATGPAQIVRDPSKLAAQTSGYFRGWHRGRRGGAAATATAEQHQEFPEAARP